MTDLQDLILHRRSIRKFKDRLLTFEEKRAILCSALVAPSSKNRRPCRLVLVEDREMINKLIRCKLIGTLPLETATWVLVVVADPTQSEAWIEDASIAAAFAQLQAEDLGLGSCWVQVRGRDYDEETSSSEYIKKLLESFKRLIERGHTLVVIEHNIDVIKCADHLIDLGPDGGENGGYLVATGTPEEVALCEASHTGAYLKEKLS